MNELHTFVSSDGRYKFTVKGDFLKKCPEPVKENVYDLMTKYKLNQYLHNPGGPAILRLADGHSDYWIDGVVVTKEEALKIQHSFDFKNEFMKEIQE